MSERIDNQILGLLVCPITKQHLLPASPSALSRIVNIDSLGLPDDAELTYLMTENQRWAYPVVNGVPWLMENKRLSLGESEAVS